VTEKRFCPACGTDVEVGAFFRAGEEVPICNHCGQFLDEPKQAAAQGQLENVLIAEDSELLRTVLKDLFENEGVAKKAVACENGEAFLEQAALAYRTEGRIDLVVLDANMPILDGYRAALAFRAMERGLAIDNPAPILFFTSVEIDDTFRNVLERCAPARYVNKQTSPQPDDLVKRIRQILASPQQ